MTEDEAITELLDLAIKGAIDSTKEMSEVTVAITHVLYLAAKAGLIIEGGLSYER